ncbi:DNA polymerase III subunit alpha [Sulfurospirillum multivorans]|uniref:DNA polymerase III subunit alpha n=2 Tax=Sulfurospirillum multivorans TaxID=66821 RepID=A0AA86AMB4_SULMK|nr:DNA polymerase III subunit alpha [Sulfurospirillum multivorans]AHJ12101.1 DNA polymerase III alpha subunit [Sulfurospirillum multivorans DSM 12446]QEH05602.1 DNA polymerase III alpha subunit [Sulfurospirillum multivorans]
MSDTPYTHLHLHTEYSLLDGANKIGKLAKKLKSQGVTSVAITDHGNMFGAIDFYKTMRKEGIKPIIGMEAYIHNQDDIGDKTTKQRFHLCLYAKNEVGYKNLMYLSSMSYIKGFYYYPRINKQILKEHSEGLVCSGACLQGEVNWHLNLNNKRNVQFGAKGYERAKEIALEYKAIFGEDFYLEVMRHGIPDQHFIDDDILRISQETGIKLIATNDTHYLEQDNAEAHEAFMCIAMNKEFDDPNRLRHSVHEFYVKSPAQMSDLFADIPEAISNTQEIVDKCNLEIKLGDPTPPKFKFTKEYAAREGLNFESDDEFFAYKSREGLEKRLLHVDQSKHEEYKARLEREIKIICDMKFPGYMLIVWDFIREAKERGVPVGPGRGSAAGSLVAFSLFITDIDPMPYNLLFERFLNPERISMPDIDIDFCQSRRGEIIDYVVEKYGRFNVAQVITFGKLLAKGVIRDVARVLAIPYAEADAMAKLIPDELGITLNGIGVEGEEGYKGGAYQKEPKLRELIESSPKMQRVWKFALALEGLNRNSGMHAAGVVISDEELWHKTPLYQPSGEDHLVTQYSLNYLEDVDLIKFDFLGLKTLTVIDNALKLIKLRYQKEIDFTTIDMNDPKVYELIQSGDTVGLFQIESSGMQSLNERLKPTNFEDLIAVLALYRPGPMESGMLDDFIDRKNGRKEISYFFDEFTEPLRPILEPTYGVIVYQEQVMQIVQSIGGFSLGEADLIRRAMGKKKIDYMKQKAEEFAQGAVDQGLDRAHAIELFGLIEKFAGYGFNKSHSAAYAMVTFETAYLKCYYPQEFMAALLTSEQDNTDKIVKYIDEVKRLGLKLLPPSIQHSLIEFSAITDADGQEAILFGMGAIKGVGNAAISKILEARADAPFADMSDFISRIDSSKVNKKVLESFIKSGSFDDFGYSRRALLEGIDSIIEASAECSRAKKMAEYSLFGDAEEMTTVHVSIENIPEFDNKRMLELEKETIGFYISGHPLDAFRAEIDEMSYTLSSEKDQIEDGSKALFIGKVEGITEKISKKGNKFGIISLMDFHGSMELTVFEKQLEALSRMDIEKPLCFKVDVSNDGQNTKMRVMKIMELSDAKKEKIETKVIEVPLDPKVLLIDLSDDTSKLEFLYQIVRESVGRRPLHLVITSKLQDVLIETGFGVDDSIDEKLAGMEFVKVVA